MDERGERREREVPEEGSREGDRLRAGSIEEREIERIEREKGERERETSEKVENVFCGQRWSRTC